MLAEALARGEARHPGARENQDAIESMRETYRRSGGTTPRLSFADLDRDVRAAARGRELAQRLPPRAACRSTPTRSCRAAVRERYAALPSTASVRDRDVEIHYDVEETPDGQPFGVARLRLPEKIARTLTEDELPALDRPLRFIVTRGARGAARATTLDELQEELERPFTEQGDRRARARAEQIERAARSRTSGARETATRSSTRRVRRRRPASARKRGRRRPLETSDADVEPSDDRPLCAM